jgi:hypothetical protein
MTGNRPRAGQDWDAEGYARHAGFVSELGAAALEMLAPHRARRSSISAAATGR